MAPMELKDYMELNYAIILRRDEEGDWVATCKELEGCVADGATPDEAIQNFESMKELWLRARMKSKRPVPLPTTEQDTFSGKFLQRVPKSLHRKLVEAAEREGVSLNQFVTAILAEAVGQKCANAESAISISGMNVLSVDAWSMGNKWDQCGWVLSHTSFDQNQRDASIQKLIQMTPTTDVIAIGRERKSAHEDPHKIWNA
jgi:predicted RNase H-like HicB family nuclease